MPLVRLARRPFFWVIALIIAVFTIAPLVGDNVDLRESLILDALYIILASNLNIMLGYTGYINFGSVVFFGLGGYFCLWLVGAFALPLGLSLLLAGICVSLLALVFGLGILKLRGHFFALSTIGIIEGVQAFVQNFKPWGGSAGLYLSGSVLKQLGGPANALWVLYFMMVAVMGLSLYLSYAVKSSKFGLGLLAIGQNEDAAAVLGVPTPLYKALAYCTSAFLPAVAGGLFFFKSAFVEPASAFDLTLSTEVIVDVMLGGQGTVFGAALGAYLYAELRGYLLTTATFSNFQLVISGALLLLIVLFFPGGLMGFIYRQFPRTQKVLE